MNWEIAVTLAITIFLAFAGYIATYVNNQKNAQRKAQIDRVNEQLKEFYGPLHSLGLASESAWVSFQYTHKPAGHRLSGEFWAPSEPPSVEEGEAWRLWMKTVFMPLNLRMVEIVTTRADLMEETVLPNCLGQLTAHVYSYAAVLKAWEQGDYSRHTAVSNFPGPELLSYSQEMYKKIKEKQATLLGGNGDPNK
ncbi:MAG: hypothetical protein KZQ80_06305 [Candidatus Thiodiazotropha sp. (ex Monitilora ramsayi)]|nr:hypothetical protein [Candidatus Thiodiazotropha sp. (ex Monitilora ramsayi)]